MSKQKEIDYTIKKNKIRYSKGDLVFTIVLYTLITLFLIIELYPMIYVLSASISDSDAVMAGKMVLWPIDPTLSGYKFVFTYSEIWTGYANTLFYTFVGTSLDLLVTIPAGYALSRRDLKFSKLIMLYFMITMYFSGGMIPGYLNNKDLGLLETRTIMVIGGALSVYNMIVCRTFFANTIPWELHEAGKVDGATDARMFLQIVVPLSKAIIAVMILYYGVNHWNSYFNAMLFLATSRDKWPLQLYLREILVQGKFAEQAIASSSLSAEEILYYQQLAKTSNMLKFVVIVIATVPMLAIYPFLQKYFEKGVMIGSVKG